jgi:predicted transcriptional regulator
MEPLTLPPTTDDIKSRCKALDVSVSALCRAAKISPALYYRAAASPGAHMNVDTITKLVETLNTILATGEKP